MHKRLTNNMTSVVAYQYILGLKNYSCNNITTTLIQISRLFYFGFFSKTDYQI